MYKKDKYLFYLALTLCIIVFIVFFTIKIVQNIIINSYDNTIIGKVINLESAQHYQKITIKYKIFKVVIIDKDFTSVKLGDVIKVEGTKQEINTNHIPYAFNYNKYFYNNLYVLQIESQKINVIKHQISIYKLNEIVNNYLSKYFKDESLMVLKGFIIGDTSSFNNELNESLKINGIIHLFAISGSHIVLIISFLELIFKKNKSKNKIINVLLFCYLLITKFSVSILRAVLTFYLNQICKLLNIKISSIDISSLVFIFLIIINPFYMYNLGFVLSFASTFLIILLNPYIRNISNIKSILVITMAINFFSFPLIVNMNHEINIMSPIINIIMILLVEGILIPFSFIVCLMPILNIVYKYIVIGFIYLNDLIATISYKCGCLIKIGHLSDFFIIVFYTLLVLLIIFCYNKKLFKLILITISLLFIIVIFDCKKILMSPQITFLDLYNGDSTLIEYKSEVILIDTGEGQNSEVTKFLKAKGIRKIDYLILTHNHSDHNGEAKIILENFIVTYIVVNEYDNSEFSKYNNTLKLKQGSILKTKNIQFNVLFPNQYNINENNNSLVLYFNIEGYNFLFTGDIEIEIEEQFFDLNVDVLKVSHHGSITSTSNSFLYKVMPTYSIIMSGRSNKFDFPSNEIIQRLKNVNSIVFCTKYNYTIILEIKNKKCIFETLYEAIN